MILPTLQTARSIYQQGFCFPEFLWADQHAVAGLGLLGSVITHTGGCRKEGRGDINKERRNTNLSLGSVTSGLPKLPKLLLPYDAKTKAFETKSRVIYHTCCILTPFLILNLLDMSVFILGEKFLLSCINRSQNLKQLGTRN